MKINLIINNERIQIIRVIIIIILIIQKYKYMTENIW